MFEDHDRQDDSEHRLECMKKAMGVLRECCKDIAGGDAMPDSFADRMRLLMTGVAQIAVMSVKWAGEEAGDPDLDDERNRHAVARAIGDVITCAVIVAERFSHDKVTTPEFSSN